MNKLRFSCLKLRVVTYVLVFSMLINFSPLYAMSSDEEWYGTYNGTHCICISPNLRGSYSNDEWNSYRSAITYTVTGAFIGFILPYLPPVCKYVYDKVKSKWNEQKAQYEFRA